MNDLYDKSNDPESDEADACHACNEQKVRHHTLLTARRRADGGALTFGQELFAIGNKTLQRLGDVLGEEPAARERGGAGGGRVG